MLSELHKCSSALSVFKWTLHTRVPKCYYIQVQTYWHSPYASTHVWTTMIKNISRSLNVRHFNLIKLLLEIYSSSLSRKIRYPLKVFAINVDFNFLNQQHKLFSIYWNNIFKAGENFLTKIFIFIKFCMQNCLFLRMETNNIYFTKIIFAE